MKVHYRQKLRTFSKVLRKQGTLDEAMLWLQLKKKQRKGFDFHRQKIIGKYIVDFWCPRLSLAIEIDGVTHDSKQDYDRDRQQALEKIGIQFLRFSERDVQSNLEGVIAEIDRWIDFHGESST